MMIAGIAQSVSLSHDGPSTPANPNAQFKGPESGAKKKLQTRLIATTLVTTGMK